MTSILIHFKGTLDFRHKSFGYNPVTTLLCSTKRPGLRVVFTDQRVIIEKALSSRNASLFVASPDQVNSHSSDASYHGEQGYNLLQRWRVLDAPSHWLLHCNLRHNICLCVC